MNDPDPNGPDPNDPELVVDGLVRLAIPPDSEYVRLARLTAAGLASRMGFTYDQVEDLRIGVSELCAWVLQPAAGAAGSVAGGNGDRVNDEVVELEYQFSPRSVTVTGRRRSPTLPAAFPELSERILGAVADEHGVSLEGGEARFWLTMHRGGAPG